MSRIMTRPIEPMAALLMMVVGLVAYGKFGSQQTPEPNTTAPAIVARTESDNLEIELITLRPEGFEPSEITRPKGAFVLFIDDRSGREKSSLVLQRINSGQLRAISVQQKKSEWSDVVDLTPGTYILQDANNSELRCQITILP